MQIVTSEGGSGLHKNIWLCSSFFAHMAPWSNVICHTVSAKSGIWSIATTLILIQNSFIQIIQKIRMFV